ncbi:MAG: DEAD/DEAH box helicase [Oscillospiraceae bacterium]
MEFDTLGVCPQLLQALAAQQITQPTPCQEQALPLLIEKKDVILQAQTGSGKTLCYLLPIYQNIKTPLEGGTQAVIIVPTKELAMQVHNQVKLLSENSGIVLRSAVIFGNVNVNTQIEHLKDKPQIVIGTTERILALIQKKKIQAHSVKTFVVDEADKLLDKQNFDSLSAVRKTMLKDTQNVFVSATMPPKALSQAQLLAPQALIIKNEGKLEVPKNISHYFIISEKRDKLDTFRKLSAILKPTKSIIFINKLGDIQLATEKLKYNKVNCATIHSDSTKLERQKALSSFATGEVSNLVATDLAARGLHVDGVSHIFSIDVSEDPIDYLHRCGRCGREGQPGVSITLASEKELQFLKKYVEYLGIELKGIKMRNGEIYYEK